MAHTALYGTVAILRDYCRKCETYSFIIKGIRQCCGEVHKRNTITGFKQMSEVPGRRRLPPWKWRKETLEDQNMRCFYCDRTFGKIVYRHARAIHLRIHWDHQIPFVYSRDNRPYNFVAACHVCNSLKAALLFNSEEEARVYLYDKWKEKGFSDFVSDVLEPLSPEIQVAKIL